MPRNRQSDWLSDSQKWLERIEQTRAAIAAFGPNGVEIGQTPKQKIAACDKARLYAYTRDTPASRPPILIVYGLVGRYTMADLLPECSVVADLLAQGHEVFVTDWGNPDRTDRFLQMEDYVCDYVDRFVDVIRETTGRDQITIMGICEGGILASLYAAQNPDKLSGLILSITPLNFHADAQAPGLLNRWLQGLDASDITGLIDLHGVLPGDVLGTVFQAISPKRTWLKHSFALMDAAQSQSRLRKFMAVETWLADRPDHPGEAAKELLINCYKENALIKGKFEMEGRPVSLADVTPPVLNIYGKTDPIVPPACTKGANTYFAGAAAYNELGIPCGHAGAFFSTNCKGIIAKAVSDWMEKRS